MCNKRIVSFLLSHRQMAEERRTRMKAKQTEHIPEALKGE